MPAKQTLNDKAIINTKKEQPTHKFDIIKVKRVCIN